MPVGAFLDAHVRVAAVAGSPIDWQVSAGNGRGPGLGASQPERAALGPEPDEKCVTWRSWIRRATSSARRKRPTRAWPCAAGPGR